LKQAKATAKKAFVRYPTPTKASLLRKVNALLQLLMPWDDVEKLKSEVLAHNRSLMVMHFDFYCRIF
jgi:hypothetical protein